MLLRNRTPAPRPVHLVRSAGKSYQAVQDEILAPIARHLSVPVAQTERTYAPGHLNLTMFIRQPADVIISHGIADKRYLWLRDPDTGERMLNRFALVMVPGRWLKQRLLETSDIRLDADRIRIVGWPRLDTLLARQRELSDDDVRTRRRRVLWAPTHDWRKRGEEQKSTSTYPEFEQHVPALEEHFDVEVSLHPRNRQHKATTHDQLLWADVVVSDFGTMVYEAWALGKPVLFPRWILEDRVATYLPKAAEGHIFAHDIGLHPGSIGEMIAMIGDGAGIGDDVTSFLDEYLEPSTLGRSGERVAEVLEEARRRPARSMRRRPPRRRLRWPRRPRATVGEGTL